MNVSSTPPKALVQTWIFLINSQEEKLVKEHAAQQLLKTFGSIEQALYFCKENNIPIFP